MISSWDIGGGKVVVQCGKDGAARGRCPGAPHGLTAATGFATVRSRPTQETATVPNAPTPPPDLTLVLGGARSGKSRFAEGLVTALGGPRIYVATSQVWDAEMAERVARHRDDRGRDDRGPDWRTIEEPLDLRGALRAHAAEGCGLLVDCLTLWLTNLMMADSDVEAETAALAALLPTLPGRVVLVSNEVGLGIVPDNALARRFRDHAGRLHQAVAAVAPRVVLTVAGLPIYAKGSAL
jgi:adenosylcobinamide kinase / adenosylcobinamide-phosphate guanylyltransferase